MPDRLVHLQLLHGLCFKFTTTKTYISQIFNSFLSLLKMVKKYYAIKIISDLEFFHHNCTKMLVSNDKSHDLFYLFHLVRYPIEFHD